MTQAQTMADAVDDGKPGAARFWLITLLIVAALAAVSYASGRRYQRWVEAVPSIDRPLAFIAEDQGPLTFPEPRPVLSDHPGEPLEIEGTVEDLPRKGYGWGQMLRVYAIAGRPVKQTFRIMLKTPEDKWTGFALNDAMLKLSGHEGGGMVGMTREIMNSYAQQTQAGLRHYEPVFHIRKVISPP